MAEDVDAGLVIKVDASQLVDADAAGEHFVETAGKMEGATERLKSSWAGFSQSQQATAEQIERQVQFLASYSQEAEKASGAIGAVSESTQKAMAIQQAYTETFESTITKLKEEADGYTQLSQGQREYLDQANLLVAQQKATAAALDASAASMVGIGSSAQGTATALGELNNATQLSAEAQRAYTQTFNETLAALSAESSGFKNLTDGQREYVDQQNRLIASEKASAAAAAEVSAATANSARSTTEQLSALERVASESTIVAEKYTSVAESQRTVAAQNAAMVSGMKQQETEFIALSDSVQRTLNRYDPLGTKLRALQSDFANLSTEISKGAGAGQELAIDKAYKSLNAEISKTKGLMAQADAEGTLNKTATAAGHAANGMSGITREITVIGRELASGNISRLPGSIALLAQYTGVLGAILNPITLGFIALAAAIGLVIYGAVEGAKEVETMNIALLKSGNIAGVTRGQMLELSEAVAGTGQIGLSNSKALVTELVASGKLGNDSLKALTGYAAQYAEATGEEVQKVGAELLKIFEDPAKGAEKLNETMHFLTLGDLEYIKTLQEMGDYEDARLVLLDKLKERTAGLHGNLGDLEKAWRAVKVAAGGAWDAMLDVGRTRTPEQLLTEQKKLVDELRARFAQPQSVDVTTPGWLPKVSKEDLNSAEALLALYSRNVTAAQQLAEAAGKAAENNKGLEAVSKVIAQTDLAKLKTLDSQIVDYRLRHDAAIASGETEERYAAGLNKLLQDRQNLLNKGSKTDSTLAEYAKMAADAQVSIENLGKTIDQKMSPALQKLYAEMGTDAWKKLSAATQQAHIDAALIADAWQHEATSQTAANKAGLEAAANIEKLVSAQQKEQAALDGQIASLIATGKATLETNAAQVEYQLSTKEVAASLAVLDLAYAGLGSTIADAMRAEAAETDAKKANVEAIKAAFEATKKYNEEFGKETDNISKQAEKIEQQTAELGLTKEQIDRLRISRIDDSIATQQQILSQQQWNEVASGSSGIYAKEIGDIQARIEALQRLRTATVGLADKQAAIDTTKAWVDAINTIAQKADDFIKTGMSQGWSKAFKKLWDDFVGWAISAFIKIAAQKVIVSIFPEMAGVLGGVAGGVGGAGGGAGGIQNLLGQGSSANTALGNPLGLPSATGLGTSFATSAAGQAIGLSSTSAGSSALVGLAAEETGAGAAAAIGTAEAGSAGLALTAAGTALTAAIPVIGTLIAAGILIYGFLKDNKPSPTRGQFQVTPTSTTTGFEDNKFTGSAFGNLGFADQGTQYFSGEAAQAFNKIVSDALDAFKTRYTPEQSKKLADILQTTTFPESTGGTQSTEDFIKQYGGEILKKVVIAAFDVLDPALSSVAEKFTGTADEFSNFANTLLGIHDAVKTFGDNFSVQLGTAFVQSFNSAQTAIAAASGGISSAVGHAMENVKPDPKPLTVSVSATIGNAMQAVKPDPKVLTGAVGATIDNALTSVKPDPRPLETAVSSTVDNAIASVKPIGKPLTDNISEAVNNAISKVPKPSIEVSAGAIAVDKLPTKPGHIASGDAAAEQAAKDFVQRFIDNVNAALADATQATADKVLAFVNAVNIAGQTLPELALKMAALDPANMIAFVDAMGGAANFASQFSFLGANFTTSTNKMSAAQTALNGAFAAAGVTAIPQTHEAFLALLDSFDLTTEDGRKAYASVMALSGAFVTIHGTADQAAERLRTANDYFEQHFFTTAEQHAHAVSNAWDQVHAAWNTPGVGDFLSAHGFDHIPTDVRQFREFIDTLDNMGPAGKAVADMLKEMLGPSIIGLGEDVQTTADKIQAGREVFDTGSFQSASGDTVGFRSPAEQTAANIAADTKKINDAFKQINLGGFADELNSLGFKSIPTSIEGFASLINSIDATRDADGHLSPAMEALYDILIVLSPTVLNLNQNLDAATAAANTAAAAAIALGVALRGEAAHTIADQFTTLMNAINELVSGSGGDFGTKTALKISLINEQIKKIGDSLFTAARSTFASIGESNYFNTVVAPLRTTNPSAYLQQIQGLASIDPIISTYLALLGQLNGALDDSTAHLTRFTVLSAQYGASIAEQLVNLEDQYHKQQDALAGNAVALAALDVSFQASWNSIINGGKDAATSLDDFIKKIQQLADATQGNAGQRVGIELALVKPKLTALETQYATLDPTSAVAKAVLADITKLKTYNDFLATELAHFAIYQAQYGKDIASQLVDLERWYDDQKTALSGNVDALAILSDIFQDKWKKIIDGIANGVDQLAKLKVNIAEYLKSLVISDISPLTPRQKLDTARQSLDAEIALAQGGNVKALGDVTQYLDKFLALDRDFNKSNSQFSTDFNHYTNLLAGIAGVQQTGQPLDSSAAIVAALPANGTLASSTDVAAVTAAVTALSSGVPVASTEAVATVVNTQNTTTITPALDYALKTVADLDALVAAAPDWTFQFGRLHDDLKSVESTLATFGFDKFLDALKEPAVSLNIPAQDSSVDVKELIVAVREQGAAEVQAIREENKMLRDLLNRLIPDLANANTADSLAEREAIQEAAGGITAAVSTSELK